MNFQSKKMRYFYLLGIICLALNSYAQSDSLTIVTTKWETEKLAPGVVLKHYWFNHSLFSSNQNINILEVEMSRKNRIDVEADSSVLKPTSTFGKEHQALAAINGTFFDMKNGGSVDYVRLNGKVLNSTRLPKNNQRAAHQKAAIIVSKNKVRIVPWDGADNWENTLKGEDVMVTGPLLLEDHRRTNLDSANFNTARHPRTALALRGSKVLLISVDGRNEKAAGMSLFELSSFLKWIEAKDAINLDGGGSTTMWINGHPDGGIINHPSDNKKMEQSKAYKPGMDLDNLAADEKKWDHGGERKVANVLLVNEKN
jgi:exopolysaccharide biosynthesis protein